MDDSRDFREILAELLVEEGYAVRLAASAEAASRSMESEAHPPDAVLLDLYLPGMTPRQFVSLMKERPRWAHSKVILVTGAERHEIPPDAPVDAVLLKPFSVDELLGLLRALRVAPGEGRGASPL